MTDEQKERVVYDKIKKVYWTFGERCGTRRCKKTVQTKDGCTLLKEASYYSSRDLPKNVKTAQDS